MEELAASMVKGAVRFLAWSAALALDLFGVGPGRKGGRRSGGGPPADGGKD
jgi:hypothetical protein